MIDRNTAGAWVLKAPEWNSGTAWGLWRCVSLSHPSQL